MIEEELERLEQIGERVFSLIQSDKLRQAEAELNKLTSSWAVGESIQIQIPLQALILSKRGKRQEAKILCLQNIAYLWGDPEALYFIRQDNPLVGKYSSLFSLLVRGGKATVGTFTQFSDRHKVSFEVVADSETEAMNYVFETARFATPNTSRVLSIEQHSVPPRDVDKKGVYWCSPFSS